MSYLILLYHIISYLTISYLILSYYIVSYLILLNHVLSYLTISYLILSYLIMSYLILLYHVLSSLTISCLILPYLTLPGHVGQDGRPDQASRWLWLVRLCFDRRSSVRTLSIRILDVVLKCTHSLPSVIDCVKKERESDIEQTEGKHASRALNELKPSLTITHLRLYLHNSINSLLEIVVKIEEWPPLNVLRNIVTDALECSAARGAAVMSILGCLSYLPHSEVS